MSEGVIGTLARVERFDVALRENLVAAAREELLARRSASGDRFRWGYLLGVEDAVREGLPTTAGLERRLRDALVEPLARATGRSYELSFLKAASGPPPEAREGVHYAGFHLDTHPAITEPAGRELARVLINLAPYPRVLRIAAVDRFTLARRGVPVDRGDYQVVDLPSDVPVRTVAIPGATETAVHALRFWASVVPHVGADGPDGHFLASYEAVDGYPSAAPV